MGPGVRSRGPCGVTCGGAVAGRLWLAVLLVAGAAATAEGQGADYDVLIERGIAEYSAGHWEEARALLTEAHASRPSARTLRGLGLVEFELRHYARAQKLLSAALVDERQPLGAALSEQTRAVLVRVRAFLGRVRLRLEPADMVVRLDGEIVQPDVEGMVTLEPGDRTLRFSRAGYADAERQVDVVGGGVSELEVVLPAVSPTVPPVVPPVVSSAVPPAASRAEAGAPTGADASAQRRVSSDGSGAGRAGRARRDGAGDAGGSGAGALPIVLLAGGGAAIVAGGILGTLAIDKSSKDASDAQASQASMLALGGDLALGVGLLAVAGSLWIWLDEDADGGAEPALSLGLGPDAALLRARGRF